MKSLLFIAIFSLSVFSQAHLERGRQHYAEGRYHHAIAALDTAEIAHSKDDNVYYLRGLVWLRLKDRGLARRDFKRAIKLNPQHCAAKTMLASIQ